MMKVGAVSALCLLGVLCISAVVDATHLEAGPPLPCGNWNCECGFNQKVGCCCAGNDYIRVEDNTHYRMISLWRELSQLQDEVEELTGKRKVAFTATFTGVRCFGPYTINVPISYNDVPLNHGNGYNPSLGIFTAPQAGTYSFSFTAFSTMAQEGDRMYHQVRLMKNAMVVASVWEDNREDVTDSGTQNVLLELERGCQVYVELLSGRELCNRGQKLNTFSGYMLYPHLDYPSP